MPRNKSTFAKGHPHYPRKGPSPLTIRQQRKRQANMIGDMLSKMYEQQRLGVQIDPTDVTRLVHTHMLLLREL